MDSVGYVGFLVKMRHSIENEPVVWIFYSGKKIHCTIILVVEQGETKPQAAYLFPILGYNNDKVSMHILEVKKHGLVEKWYIQYEFMYNL